MLGKPKFKVGDIVRFTLEEKEFIGHVVIVDAYGTLFQKDEPSYDIMVENGAFLCKHIRESDILKNKQCKNLEL